jgi:hypothetical protein
VPDQTKLGEGAIVRSFVASLLLAWAAVAAPGVAGTVAAVEIEGGACSLVTSREIIRELGGRRWPEATGGPEDPLRCARHNDQLGRRSKALLVKFTPATQDQSDSFRADFLSSYPDAAQLDIGGFPAVQDEGTLHVFVGPQGWLSVETSSESRRDYGKLKNLAAIAVGRLDPGLLGEAPVTEPTGDLCASLPIDAVSAVVGEPLSVAQQAPDSCVLVGDLAAGSQTNLTVQHAQGDPQAPMPLIDQVREAFPVATEIDVGGVPAIQPAPEPGPDGFTTGQLVVFPDPASVLFLIATVPDSVDVATALASIAELAVAGLAAPPA